MSTNPFASRDILVVFARMPFAPLTHLQTQKNNFISRWRQSRNNASQSQNVGNNFCCCICTWRVFQRNIKFVTGQVAIEFDNYLRFSNCTLRTVDLAVVARSLAVLPKGKGKQRVMHGSICAAMERKRNVRCPQCHAFHCHGGICTEGLCRHNRNAIADENIRLLNSTNGTGWYCMDLAELSGYNEANTMASEY